MTNRQIKALKEDCNRLLKLINVAGKIEIYEITAIAEDIKEIAENADFE